MPSQHVGQPGPEHIGLEQRAFLGVWREPAAGELLLAPAHRRGQPVAAVSAEEVAALGGAEPVVRVLGDPYLVPGQARRTPGPGPVGRQPRTGRTGAEPRPVAGARRGRLIVRAARRHRARRPLMAPVRIALGLALVLALDGPRARVGQLRWLVPAGRVA